MTELAPPGLIFVEAGDALLMYASANAAAACPHLARVEDRAGLIAYGSKGEPYRVHHVGGRLAFEQADEPARSDALKELLLEYFEACEDPADADEPLDELVARAWTIECNYRLRCGSDDDIASRRMPLWGYFAIIAIPALILFLALRYR